MTGMSPASCFVLRRLPRRSLRCCCRPSFLRQSCRPRVCVRRARALQHFGSSVVLPSVPRRQLWLFCERVAPCRESAFPASLLQRSGCVGRRCHGGFLLRLRLALSVRHHVPAQQALVCTSSVGPLVGARARLLLRTSFRLGASRPPAFLPFATVVVRTCLPFLVVPRSWASWCLTSPAATRCLLRAALPRAVLLPARALPLRCQSRPACPPSFP